MSNLTAIARLLRGHGGRRSRRRRQCSPIAPAAVLEARVMLAATTIAPLTNVTLDSGSDLQVVELGNHFDDPDITGSTVEISTPLGNFIIETYDAITPLTAQNFVELVAGGNYTDMFIHRSDPDFVIQGGGYTFSPTGLLDQVAHNGAVVNEFANWFDPEIGGLEEGTPLNVRGTVAMAKQAGNPNSATSEWFVSLNDNSTILDPQNGGFTVFGHVLFDGMDTVDAIAALPVFAANPPFNELPVRNYESGNILREHVVMTTTTVVEELTYEVTANSNPDVVTAIVLDGNLRISGVREQSGSATITVTATDLQGQTATSTMTVTVPLSSTITAPIGNLYTRRPTFTWSTAAQATEYELWVNRIGGPTAIIHETALTETTFTPAADLPFGEYRVWIRPKNGATNGDWSVFETFIITLEKPTLTSPAVYDVTQRQPVIEWTASPNATEYDLWISRVGTGGGLLIREPSLTTTEFTPPSDLADGVYRVWVRAKAASVESAWSVGLTFEIAITKAPEITSPTGKVATARPEFTWTGNESDTYELWVNQIGGAARVIHETAITGTSFTPSIDLANASYKVWARKRPASGEIGNWSAAFQFVVSVQPGTTQISNITGTDTARPTFTWSAATQAVRYELWVNDVTGSVARVIHLTSLTELQHTSTVDLAAGQYRAWIRAFAGGNVAGGWSSAVNFSIT